jgi:hypothetical protein
MQQYFYHVGQLCVDDRDQSRENMGEVLGGRLSFDDGLGEETSAPNEVLIE